MNKIIKQIADIIYDHCFCFFGYMKRVRIPAPITVKKNAVRQILFEPLAYRCFAGPPLFRLLNIMFSLYPPPEYSFIIPKSNDVEHFTRRKSRKAFRLFLSERLFYGRDDRI